VALAHDGIDEDLGAEDTVDVTGIVTEEDTTEGGEGAEEVGLPGDGGLDVLDILRGVEDGRGPALLGRLLKRVGHC